MSFVEGLAIADLLDPGLDQQQAQGNLPNPPQTPDSLARSDSSRSGLSHYPGKACGACDRVPWARWGSPAQNASESSPPEKAQMGSLSATARSDRSRVSSRKTIRTSTTKPWGERYHKQATCQGQHHVFLGIPKVALLTIVIFCIPGRHAD